METVKSHQVNSRLRSSFFLPVICFSAPGDAVHLFPKKYTIFFTLYEAQEPFFVYLEHPSSFGAKEAPNCSSQLSSFFELGPWRLNPTKNAHKNLVLEHNPGAWNRKFGLLFLYNPLGLIPKNQYTIVKHLISALTSFISADPLFKSRPISITGESYAGKYIPAGGVATHAATAYYSGLINGKQRTRLEEIQAQATELTQKTKWKEATDAHNRVLNWLQNATGLATLFYLWQKTPYETEILGSFLNKDRVKKFLGVDKSMVWVECSEAVVEAMYQDVKSKSKILLYQGQFDLEDGVVSIETWVKEMSWEGLESFLMAKQKVWKVNGELAWYVEKWGSLSEVVVSGAG
ncbi:hypothetical protein NE237_009846 [Protea cynaroides]|uniref:Carboxypeptidase n=1 Tax=Protea cynaroides TaxID=273540 RepID=A0A9Q0KZ45_9MAGN|nr:hypothetical protein NE237_009846 [Protea cynaroides]